VAFLEYFVGFIVFVLILSSIRIIDQYQRGVKFRLGRFSGTLQPGLNFIIPIIDRLVVVDMRIQTIDIPEQQVMTKDNVPMAINGVIYFQVSDPEIAVIKIQNFTYAISQYAQTALKDVIGGMSLDEVLAKREDAAEQIEKLVVKETAGWGLTVTAIKMQDINLPEELKRIMSRQASAEREKRATIIKAEGDRDAAANLAQAAKIMAANPGAMQLRTLQTIDGLGPTPSNTVVLFPIDIVEALEAFKQWADAMKKKKPE
jgi:regulator of protease activity HflC (stomatin/prohibitin superfamily)